MYHKDKRDQEEGGQICVGIRSEIQNLDRLIDFSNPRRIEHRMVH
jgi:hypothetical protein